MWVGQLGGDVEFKVVVVRNNGISKLYHCTALLFECLRKKKACTSV